MNEATLPPIAAEVLKRARALREELRQTEAEFTQADYRKQLDAACQDLDTSGLDGLLDWAATRVDEESTRDVPGRQFYLYGDYKLGDGRRIAKAHARLDHMEEALLLDDQSLQERQAEKAQKREEMIQRTSHLSN
jgi:hypothetical protein